MVSKVRGHFKASSRSITIADDVLKIEIDIQAVKG